MLTKRLQEMTSQLLSTAMVLAKHNERGACFRDAEKLASGSKDGIALLNRRQSEKREEDMVRDEDCFLLQYMLEDTGCRGRGMLSKTCVGGCW